jgi:hypothetical protein
MKKPKEAKRKKSRRDNVKHPNLKAKFMPRVRSEYVDMDYINSLSEPEKDWLDKFTAEYHGASFKRDGTDIQPYDKYGKDCNDRNNSQNRDQYGRIKNKLNKKLLNYDNVLRDVEELAHRDADPKQLENDYVDYIDFKQLEKLETFALELDELEDHAEQLDFKFLEEALQEYDTALELFAKVMEQAEYCGDE